MADDGANVKFGGDAAELVEAAKKATEAVTSAVEGMQAKLEGLNGVFERVTKGFAIMSAAVAGGAALKEFVAVSEEVTHSAMSLGKSLGISATEASVFKGALNEVGVSQDAVAMAGKRITQALAAGGEKFAALGIATKDANGNFRNSKDLMLDVNEKLRGFKEGTDRNIEAQKLYGRSYQDLMPLISKFTDISEDSAKRQGISQEQANKMVDEARERAEALNLVVGQESIDATKAYDKAQRGLKEVFEGVQRTVGEALIPKLTEMATFFSSIGPAAVTVMTGVMNTYMAVQDAVRDVVMTLVDVFRQVFNTIGQVIADTFGESSEPMTGMKFFANVLAVVKAGVQTASLVIQSAMNVIGGAISEVMVTAVHGSSALSDLVHGDWAGAKREWQQWSDETAEIIRKTVERGAKIAEEGIAKIGDTLTSDPTARKKVTDAKAPGSDGKGSSGQAQKGGGGDAIAKAEAERTLAIKKEQLAEEMRAVENSYQQQITANKEFFAAKQKNEEEAIDAELAAKQKELAASKQEAAQAGGDIAKTNALKAQQIKLDAEITVLTMKRRQVATDTANAEMKAEVDAGIKMEEARIANQKKLTEIDLAGREAVLANAREMGEVTAEQELQAQRRLLDEKYQNELQALTRSLALYEFDRDQRAKISDQIEQLNAQHNLDVSKNTMATAAATEKSWNDVLTPITQNFASSLDAMRKHQMTFGDAMRSLYDQMMKTFINHCATEVTTWASKELAKTAAQTTGDAVRTGSATTAATETGAASSTAAVVQIGNSAVTAAAGSFSAMASIPYVGPILGAAAAVAALGLIMGYKGSVKSARGGYDIPSGVNPLTQLHEEEMVLPKGPANALRDIAENGTAGGGDTHLHVHAMDTKGVKQFLGANAHHIAAALRGQNAKFGLT